MAETEIKDIVLIDWLSFTSKSLTVQNIKCLLGLELAPWEAGHGAHGFKESDYFQGIKIFFNSRAPSDLHSFADPDEVTVKDESYLVWLDMSGSGCRAFETFGNGDFDGIFRFVLSREDCQFTRIDVAFDDHSGLLDIVELKEHTDQHYFVSKFRRGIVEYNWDRLKDRSYKAFTLYFGSQKSDVMIRIYDKAKERNKDDEHWIRVETQLRHENAAGFAAAVVGRDVGQVYRGIVSEYLRFVDPTPDSNMRRWPTIPSWERFLDGVAAINIFSKPGVEYNMAKLQHYSLEMAGGATYTLISAVGVQAFLEMLLDSVGGRELNPNYQQLLQQLGRDPDDGLDWVADLNELRSAAEKQRLSMAVLASKKADLDRRLSDAELLLKHWRKVGAALDDDLGVLDNV